MPPGMSISSMPRSRSNHFSKTSLINALEMAGYETLHTGQKVVEVNANMGHPAVFGFWRKSAVKAEVPRRDPLMVERMAEYVARSKGDLEAMDARLRAVIEKHPRVVVWGTGQLAIKLLIETCLGQADIAEGARAFLAKFSARF